MNGGVKEIQPYIVFGNSCQNCHVLSAAGCRFSWPQIWITLRLIILTEASFGQRKGHFLW